MRVTNFLCDEIDKNIIDKKLYCQLVHSFVTIFKPLKTVFSKPDLGKREVDNVKVSRQQRTIYNWMDKCDVQECFNKAAIALKAALKLFLGHFTDKNNLNTPSCEAFL